MNTVLEKKQTLKSTQEQTTLVMLKPDCVQRRMVGTVLSVLENFGMSIIELQLKTLTKEEASELYSEHRGKWHFDRNIGHVTSGPCVVAKLRGIDAIAVCRQFVKSFRQTHNDVVVNPQNLIHATSDANRINEELISVGLSGTGQ